MRRSFFGFSRTDLAATVVASVVLFVAVVFWAVGSRQGAKEAQCAANLRVLGMAAAMYENANGGRLPYGYIIYGNSRVKTWDQLISPFISPAGSEGANAYLLRCPSDTIPVNPQLGTRRRTYAMPTHSMMDNPTDWPPGPDNDTGIGLFWMPDGWGMANLTNVVFLSKKAGLVEKPTYFLNMIRAPATTLFLTENAQSNNIAFHYFGATVDGPSDQLEPGTIDPNQYHGGKFNYLMIDGHVELLFPLQSLGRNDLIEDGSGQHFPNVWTVNPDD